MNTRQVLETVGLVTMMAVAGAGCAPKAPTTLPEADKTAIGQAAEAYINAANAHDYAALAGLYAEDAVLLPPNHEAVNGRPAIEGFFNAFPPFSDFGLTQSEVDGRGDLAYVMGIYSLSMTLPDTTATVAERGKYVEIWRKEADGSWKILRDIFNSDLPIPMVEPTTPEQP